ncbi:MAG: DUF6585 family protein [Eubacteriales bacterium]|jgi:hypothetical protein
MKNQDLGVKKNRIRISLSYVVPLFYPVVALFMIGLLVLPSSTLSDQPIYSILVTAAGALLTVYIFVQIFHCGIELYENGIVIVSVLNKKVIMRDEINIIHWDRPGQFAGTTRTVVRKTNGTAEVILKGGKMIKIPDSMYKNLDRVLGEWQSEQKIPFEF